MRQNSLHNAITTSSEIPTALKSKKTFQKTKTKKRRNKEIKKKTARGE